MAVTWKLTTIQRRAFTMRCSVYGYGVRRVGGRIEPGALVLVAENVPCRVTSRSEVGDIIGGLLRGNVDQMDTTDNLRLPELMDGSDAVQIGDGWMVRLTAGAGGENGSWMQIQGEGRNLTFRAATRVYMVTKTTAPAVVP